MALAIETTDQFNDLSNWTDQDLGDVDSVASGGQLVQSLVSSSGFHYGDVQRALGELTNNRVVIEVVEAISDDGNNEMGLSVGPTLNWDDAGFRLRGGTLSWRTHAGGSETLGTIDTFDPVAHRWWLIADLSGTFLWATSPDGVDWTAHHTASHSHDLSSVTLSLWAGTFSEVSDPGVARWDNLNLWLPAGIGDAHYLLTQGYGGDDPWHIVTHGLRSRRLSDLRGSNVTASMGRATVSERKMGRLTLVGASMGRATITRGGH